MIKHVGVKVNLNITPSSSLNTHIVIVQTFPMSPNCSSNRISFSPCRLQISFWSDQLSDAL